MQDTNASAYEGANGLTCTLNSDGSGWQFVGTERDLSASAEWQEIAIAMSEFGVAAQGTVSAP